MVTLGIKNQGNGQDLAFSAKFSTAAAIRSKDIDHGNQRHK